MAIETIRSDFGYFAEVAADDLHALYVRFLDHRVKGAGGLPFSPETNSHGDLAYATALAGGVKGALELSDIYLNDERIARDRPVLDMAMTDTTLAWLETAPFGTIFSLYDLSTGARTSETLPIATQRLVRNHEDFLMNGVDLSTGDTVVARASPGAAATETSFANEAIFLGGDSDHPSLVRVAGDQSGQILYAALDRFLRPETEEFARVGNDAGRLAWYQSYRLMAAGDLAAATGDPGLQARAVAAAMDVLGQADANGNFPSTRYSLHDDPLTLSVNSGWIYHGAFAAYQWMSPAQRQALVSQAEKSFASFESDWFDYGYRFTPGSDFYLDGVIQPVNMQSAMGLMALDLYRATGEQAYLDRVAAIWHNIASELIVKDGTAFWNYWPDLFNQGWSEGSFDSVNAPTHAPAPDIGFDDASHAALTIPFLLAGAEALGLPDVIDPDALFRSVHLGTLDFAAVLDGASGGYAYLPPWPDAPALWPLLTRELPSLLPHYDAAIFDWMYAGAALGDGAGTDTQVQVELLDPQTRQVTQTLTLTGAAEILAFVEAHAFDPGATVGPPVDMATASDDSYHGTPGADAVRLLDGNDAAALGEGDDLAMGDYGADHLSGEGGADSLFGGFGDDLLSGGPGDDLLSGQAGDDVLIGGAGADTLVGGGGIDTADYSASVDRIAVDLSIGEGLGGDAHLDRLLGIENLIGTDGSFKDWLTGDADANVLRGLAGDDELRGLAGDDTLIGGAGADLLDGGEGVDTADYSASVDRIAVDLSTGEGLGGDAHLDRLLGIENLIGTDGSFKDWLTGDADANVLRGLAGDDELRGLAGNDTLIGGAGADLLDGGEGVDTADYSASVDRIAVDLSTGEGLGGDAHLDRLLGIENLIGTDGSFKDWLTGDADANVLRGLAGDDELRGLAGNDTLVGGAGADLLVGGEGADLFVFNTADGDAVDTIADFEPDRDRIEIGSAGSYALVALGDRVEVYVDGVHAIDILGAVAPIADYHLTVI